MDADLQKLCEKAAKIVLSIPKNRRIRVISHYDADGITAAAIVCKALYRAGYDFHASLMRNPFDKGLQRISKEENELIIFTDMGSGQLEYIENINAKSIIIDHHQLIKKETKKHVFQINANQCGINGNYEACGASLSYLFAKAIDSRNIDLSPLALVGITGDKQYIGGIRGFNKTILDEALENNFVEEKTGIKLYGSTLFDSLYYSVDPYYSGLSGNKEGVLALLKKLGLDQETKITDLDDKTIKKINSYLLYILIKKRCEKNILDTVIRKRYQAVSLFNCELERFADLLDACGKGGNRGLGLSVCFGDKKSFDDAILFEVDYKNKILGELLSLESDGVKEKKSFRYFYSKDSSLGGVVCGIATNFIFDNKKPLISIVRHKDEIHVSCRGNQYLVSRGLDLGMAMKDAASMFGGHGGGHKIAAGATLNSDKEEEFLNAVDEIISKQLKV